MKLYISEGSPYARLVRILVSEKGLAPRIEMIPAQTRMANSPYYQINPSGRVPYLVRGDGVGMEESSVICAYLDQLDDKPLLNLPSGADRWEALRLEANARSLLDGLSVWLRETTRPSDEQSPTIIAHEGSRAARLLDVWERQIGHPMMSGPLSMGQMALACALTLETRIPKFSWRAGRPQLAAWYDSIAARPSFAQTAPPAKH